MNTPDERAEFLGNNLEWFAELLANARNEALEEVVHLLTVHEYDEAVILAMRALKTVIPRRRITPSLPIESDRGRKQTEEIPAAGSDCDFVGPRWNHET